MTQAAAGVGAQRRLARATLSRGRRAGRFVAWLVCGVLLPIAGGQTSQPQTGPASEPTTKANGSAWVPAQVTRTDTGLLDVHVRDMEISTLLEMLSYQARANIVTSTRVTGRVSANLYAVALEQALEAILTPNHYAFAADGSTVFVGTPEEIAALRPPPMTRVFKLRYIRPAEAAKAVKAVLGPEAAVVEGAAETGSSQGSGGSGGGSGGGGALSTAMGTASADYLVVTDYPDRLNAVQKLLAELDQRPKQVLIEATVLRATLNESNQFGIDFSILGGVDFENVGSTSAASADLHTGQLPPNKLQNTTLNVNTQFTSNVTGGGFTFGIINNGVAAFIRALEEVTDVVVVANPKVVALNKQEADVIVGRRDGYVTTTVTQTAAIQSVEFLENRHADQVPPDDQRGRHGPPRDSPEGQQRRLDRGESAVRGNDRGAFRSVGERRGYGADRRVVSRADRQLQEPDSADRRHPAGRAGFREPQRSDDPRRGHHSADGPRHQGQCGRAWKNQELLEDVERMRVGVRAGLLGTGRERLAQAHFHAALADLERGGESARCSTCV